jgi:hypothetical protein
MAMVAVRFRDSQWQWWWCDLGIQTSEEVDSDKVKRRCFFFVFCMGEIYFLKKKMVKYKIIIFSLPLKLIFKWRSIFHLEPMSIFLATLLKNQ